MNIVSRSTASDSYIPNIEYKDVLCSAEFPLGRAANWFCKALDERKEPRIGDLGQEDLDILARECSLESLEDPDGQPIIKGKTFSERKKNFKNNFKINAKYDHLQVVQNLRKRIASKTKPAAGKYYKGIRLAPIETSKPGIKLRPKRECVITIRAYSPFIASCFHPVNKTKINMKDERTPYNTGPKLSFEVAVLGRQLLTELRDIFLCKNNIYSTEDISEKPFDPPKNQLEGNSGFFFINNVFYNDFRNAKSSDLSEVIRNWAKEQSLAPELKSASMADTTFNDMNIRIGAPCLYQHQGCCEHVFVISDVHIIDPNFDSLNLSDYPMFRTIVNEKLDLCTVCRFLPAKKLTKLHSRVPQYETCLWCDDCFISFNYIDGKKVGSFKAYHYRQSKRFTEAPPLMSMETDSSSCFSSDFDDSD